MHALRRLLLAGLAALVVAMSAGASNSVTYQDSTGEDPLAPDITTITVSNDDAGLITFRINVANRPQLTRDMAMDLYVDSDSNTTTGDPESLGADYVIELFLGEVSLFKWDGTTFTRRVGDPPATTLVYSWSAGATVKISAAELGNTRKFAFDVIVISGLVIDDATGNVDSSNSKADVAPPFSAGFFSYEVKVAPARLVLKKMSTTPAAPRAGKPFTVRLSATRSDTGATISGGQVSCTAKAGGKTLKPKSAKFVGAQAVCIFQVPAGTRGQMLRGTITIVFEGKKLTRPFAGKIT